MSIDRPLPRSVLAALFDIEEATSRLRARTVVFDKLCWSCSNGSPAQREAILIPESGSAYWNFLDPVLGQACCHQCRLAAVSPLAPNAIARACEGLVSILTAPATVCTVSHAPYPQHAQEGAPEPGAPLQINRCPCFHPCCSLRSLHR